jgi:tetratricopeptide (TPR) repeat protein
MLTTKKTVRHSISFFLFAAWILTVTGCMPAGPRAVLEGEKFLAEKKYANAIEHLQVGVKLVPTNALAWNLLGVAYHQAGQAEKALQSYHQALARDRNLAAARYNMGVLHLEQRNFQLAIEELTTFTALQPQSVEGWQKLGTAHLQRALRENGPERQRQFDLARRAFEFVNTRLTPTAEAHNALGVISTFRAKPRDALASFQAALQTDSGFAPAVLNQAIVYQVQLRDPRTALNRYKEYYSMRRSAPNATQVGLLIQNLENDLAPKMATVETNQQQQVGSSPSVGATSQTGAASTNIFLTNQRSNALQQTNRAAAATNQVAAPTPRTNAPPVAQVNVPTNRTSRVDSAETAKAPRTPEPPVTIPNTPPVEVAAIPEPAPIVAAGQTPPQTVPENQTAEPAPSTTQTNSTSTNPVVASLPVPGQRKTEKGGVLRRLNPASWFNKDDETEKKPERKSPPVLLTNTLNERATAANAPAVAATNSTPRVLPLPPAPRGKTYSYSVRQKPAAGNRRAAESHFEQGLQAQRENQLAHAIGHYEKAVSADSTFFEAHYNLGLAAYETGNLEQSLRSYEHAVLLSPDSPKAQYNFSLALVRGEYFEEAAKVLEALLSKHPTESRARLMVANLYAQQLYRTREAREHYRKLLDAEPAHPQAPAIRYWLAANPEP